MKKTQSTIKNIFHKNSWRTSAVQIHVDPTNIPLIKSKIDVRSERDCLKIKLSRDPTTEKSEFY